MLSACSSWQYRGNLILPKQYAKWYMSGSANSSITTENPFLVFYRLFPFLQQSSTSTYTFEDQRIFNHDRPPFSYVLFFLLLATERSRSIKLSRQWVYVRRVEFHPTIASKSLICVALPLLFENASKMLNFSNSRAMSAQGLRDIPNHSMDWHVLYFFFETL
jgi:hypothetical protein